MPDRKLLINRKKTDPEQENKNFQRTFLKNTETEEDGAIIQRLLWIIFSAPFTLVHEHPYVSGAYAPIYPFGHGLSYTTFRYNKLQARPAKAKLGQPVAISVEVSNTGDRVGDEVVQLYIRDSVSSVSRPVKELKDFRRISVAPGETKTVSFQVTPDKLQFYNQDMKRVVEPGEFQVMVGTSSAENLKTRFEVIE